MTCSIETKTYKLKLTAATAQWLEDGHVPAVLLRFGLYKLEPVREAIVAAQEAVIFDRTPRIAPEVWELLP